MKLLLSSLALCASVLLAVPAAADVVGQPPATCPNGSEPSTCHGGPHCNPLSCTTSADCATGTCQDISYCVKTISCAGNIPPGEDPSQYDREVVEGLCTGSCGSGAPCKTLKVCATGSSSGGAGGSEAGGSSSGCAVSTAAGHAGEVAFPALAAALGVVLRRRRAASGLGT